MGRNKAARILENPTQQESIMVVRHIINAIFQARPEWGWNAWNT